MLQSRDSFLHNSVLQSTIECLENHDNLVPEAAELLSSVFQSESFSLSQLPGMLRAAYSEDEFMIYESMHVILSDLNKLDCDEVKLALEESTLV